MTRLAQNATLNGTVARPDPGWCVMPAPMRAVVPIRSSVLQAQASRIFTTHAGGEPRQR